MELLRNLRVGVAAERLAGWLAGWLEMFSKCLRRSGSGSSAAGMMILQQVAGRQTHLRVVVGGGGHQLRRLAGRQFIFVRTPSFGRPSVARGHEADGRGDPRADWNLVKGQSDPVRSGLDLLHPSSWSLRRQLDLLVGAAN